MDTRTIRSAALALLLASAAVVAQDAPRQRFAFGVPYLIPPSAVPLEPDQREKLAALRRELHDEQCRLGSRLVELQEELRAAAGQEQRAAARLTQKIDALRREAIAARADAVERAEALLTEEQRTTLAHWREGQRGEPGELGEELPYSVLPGIESEGPAFEDLEDPALKPPYPQN